MAALRRRVADGEHNSTQHPTAVSSLAFLELAEPAQLSPRVGEVLKATQLIGVFQIFDNLEEGLSSFS